MLEIVLSSSFFGVMISLLCYAAGTLIKKKLKLAVFNPLMISVVLVIILLSCLDIEYDTYSESAKFLSYLLTPATICLAIPLYEQTELLRKNWKAVLGGILAGVIASLVSVLIMAVLFGLSHEEYVTLLPKSVTTAIGMAVSEELGGIPTITVAVIIVTGILGNMFAGTICKIFHIDDPIARGVAIGTSSHALGTAKAVEMGEVEGAMSGLSIAVAGVLTVIGASVFSYIY